MRWPSWPKFVCIRMALPCSHRTERISSEANGRESRVTMSEGKKKRVKSSIRNKPKSFFYAG